MSDQTEIIERLARLEETGKSASEKLDKLEAKWVEYVSQHEFKPVRIIAYGLAGSVMIAVLSAVLQQVLVS